MPDKARFYDALKVSQSLLGLYDGLMGEVNLADVLRTVATVVCRSLHAERATIYLVDHERQELFSLALIGNVPREIRVPIQASTLAGFCALTGRAFVVEDAYGDLSHVDPDLRFGREWDQINNFRTRDVLTAPCRFRDRTLGVIQLVNSKAETFCQDDLAALATIARMVSYALYHARLYDDLATLKQLEKQKADFMRILVHELKSPVSSAKMLTDLLRTQHRDNEALQRLTGRIAGRMDQMGEMIGDILNLAKVKSGDPLGEVAVLDLAAETRAACGIHQDQARAKGLAMTVDLPPDPVPVRMDSRGYHLIVSNLVSNAVKYTESGSVDVGLAAREGWARLVVRDSGMGIPPADVPKLFREFYRASNAKKSSIQGTGVGLAGAKSIVDRFGGHLELDSRENEGTTFTVRLPLYVET